MEICKKKYDGVWIIISPFCLQTGPCEARGFVHPVVGSSLQSEASEEQQPLSQQPAPQSRQFRCDYVLCCDAECAVLCLNMFQCILLHSSVMLLPALEKKTTAQPESVCHHRSESRAQEGREGRVGVRKKLEWERVWRGRLCPCVLVSKPLSAPCAVTLYKWISEHT